VGGRFIKALLNGEKEKERRQSEGKKKVKNIRLYFGLKTILHAPRGNDIFSYSVMRFLNSHRYGTFYGIGTS
jgi:hypothetical protein